MQVSQLKPGYTIFEHNEDGAVTHYEVISIRQVGKMFEVTLNSVLGMASALYPANAFVQAAAA